MGCSSIKKPSHQVKHSQEPEKTEITFTPNVSSNPPSEKKINSDTLSNLELKANFYFDSKQACIDYIYLDTLYSLCKLNKCAGQQSIEDFLKYCTSEGRKYCGKTFDDDFQQLKQDIENGNFSVKVVSWYTKESFVYPLINNTFRTGDYKKIFKTRYFINNLNDSLNQIQHSPIFQVFRGTIINKEEYEVFKSNLGKPILLRGFISTSSKLSVAEEFLRNRKPDAKKYKLLIKINVDHNHQYMLHSIKAYSKYAEEEENLLNSYSIMIVDSIAMNQDLVEVECRFSDFEECKRSFHYITLEYKEKFKDILKNTYCNDNFFLGEVFRYSGRYKDSLAIFSEIPDTDSTCCAQKCQHMGIAYLKKGDLDNALRYLSKCLDLYIEIHGQSHEKTASAHTTLGLAYSDKGEYENALLHYHKALSIQRITLGENHAITGETYNNIGVVCFMKGDYTSALINYNTALDISLQNFGENHPQTASTYQNLGNAYLTIGELEKSFTCFDKCLQIRNLTLGDNHPDIATAYNNLGNTFFQKGDYDNAFLQFEKSLKIQVSAHRENHPDTAITLNNLGLVSFNKLDYSNALQYYEKCLQIQKDIGENNPNCVMTYNNIGNAYAKKGDMINANKAYKNALDISIAHFGEKHPNVAMYYMNIGCGYLERGENDKALAFFEKSLEIYLTLFGNSHPLTAQVYHNIGTVYYLNKDFNAARSFYEKSLNIRQAIFGENHPETVKNQMAINMLTR